MQWSCRRERQVHNILNPTERKVCLKVRKASGKPGALFSSEQGNLIGTSLVFFLSFFALSGVVSWNCGPVQGLGPLQVCVWEPYGTKGKNARKIVVIPQVQRLAQMTQTVTRSMVQNISKSDFEQTAAQSLDAYDVADIEPTTDELERNRKTERTDSRGIVSDEHEREQEDSTAASPSTARYNARSKDGSAFS